MPNSSPFLSGFVTGIIIYEEFVNLGPRIIGGDVTFSDVEDNFDGGALVMSGLLEEDILSINSEGLGAGQIGFDGSLVRFSGAIIGTATGGTNGTSFNVTFNSNATSAAIEALIENLTYENLSDTPTLIRTLKLTIADADGAIAPQQVALYEITSSASNIHNIDVGSNSSPVFSDIDGDGDLDLVIGEFGGTLKYYQNTGNAKAALYVEITGAADPFNGIGVGNRSTPQFVDIDMDGDQDMVVGEGDGNLNYFENTGTALAPIYTVRFNAANPFNGIDIGSNSSPAFGDIDGDGDQDVVIGEINGNLNYYENIGTTVAPVYVVRTGVANPFDGLGVNSRSAPQFVDFDNDGDQDLVIGERDGKLFYFENSGTALAPVYVARTGTSNPFDGIDVGSLSKPVFGDINGDGTKDLVIGDDDGILNYYVNSASTTAPDFIEQTVAANPFDGISIWSYLIPDLVDLDYDGDLDIVVGKSVGQLDFYENTGTLLSPIYVAQTGAANPFNGIDVGSYSAPVFTDLDGDGDQDLVIGEGDGNLNFYENTGNAIVAAYTLRIGAADPFDGINIGADSIPTFVDVDNDGDQDLVIGEAAGNLNFYENTGTVHSPTYVERTGAANPFDGIDIDTASTPVFVDLDMDGDQDLVTGELDGTLNFYENTGNGLAPVYVERVGTANPFNGIDVFQYSAPTFADIDGDGDQDLVVGNRFSDLTYYENTDSGIKVLLKVQPHDDPSAGDDVMNGTSGNDTIDGLGGNDTIRGYGGNDTLIGGTGDDTLDAGAGFDTVNGDAGDDTIMGSTQADVIDGGADTDTVDYSGATNTQKINLVTNVNIGGFAHGDTLLNVENVIGSDTRKDDVTGSAGNNDLHGMGADDFLRGFHGADNLFGGEGNDFLFGGTGADDMDGGNGNDWAMYNGLTVGVTVNLLTGLGTGGQADGDTYANIERVRGSLMDDTITGTNGINKLLGDGGADTINGMGGKDVIRGGDGDDTINGGAGNDGMRGDAGSDTFIFELGSGHDFVIDFEDGIDTLNIDDALYGGGLTIEELVNNHMVMENDTRFHFDFGNGDVLHVLTTSAMVLNDFYDDVTIV